MLRLHTHLILLNVDINLIFFFKPNVKCIYVALPWVKSSELLNILKKSNEKKEERYTKNIVYKLKGIQQPPKGKNYF